MTNDPKIPSQRAREAAVRYWASAQPDDFSYRYSIERGHGDAFPIVQAFASFEQDILQSSGAVVREAADRAALETVELIAKTTGTLFALSDARAAIVARVEKALIKSGDAR